MKRSQMSKSKNIKIHEFDPVIYPTRLYVAIDPPFEDVEDMFYMLNDDGEVVDEARREFDNHYSAIATTFMVANKKDNWKGCLVVIWRRKECSFGVCAHEATHVYDWIDKELGLACQEWGNDEPKAYLVQWIANCIGQVLRGK